MSITVPTGVPAGVLEPGSAEWMRYMSASKIAAVVGLSPWESKFSLYHRMTGLVPAEPENTNTRRGHYLEPAVADWFADQHPEWRIEDCGSFLHEERRWQAATPDRLAALPDGSIAVVECKSTADMTGWGYPGTDEIPVYYRCQVMWQMDVLGLQRCHVAMIGPSLVFAEYVVDYDETEAQILRDAAEVFLADVEARRRPALDDSTATYQVVRQLHPDIADEQVLVPDELAVTYLQAVADERAAKATKQGAAARLLDLMGSARDAYWNGQRIAYRMAKGTDTPYLCAARGATDQLTERDAA